MKPICSPEIAFRQIICIGLSIACLDDLSACSPQRYPEASTNYCLSTRLVNIAD